MFFEADWKTAQGFSRLVLMHHLDFLWDVLSMLQVACKPSDQTGGAVLSSVRANASTHADWLTGILTCDNLMLQHKKVLIWLCLKLIHVVCSGMHSCIHISIASISSCCDCLRIWGHHLLYWCCIGAGNMAALAMPAFGTLTY